MVWYCWVAVVDVPSFSLKAENGTAAVPLLGCWLFVPPNPPADAPKPPVVVLALVEPEPNALPVFPPPNKPEPPAAAPNPLVLFWPPKRPPPVLLAAAPNAGVDVVLLLAPKPPNVDPVEAAPPPPKRPPPVVELPNGFEPKAVEPVFVPKPPIASC
jgi:hypothetical protein